MITSQILVASLLLCVPNACGDVFHRHRHSRSHPSEYHLDRLMNRLDSHTTTQPPLEEQPSTESEEPGNSLWDDDFTFGVTGTVSPLDMDRWDKIINEKEKQREDREDVEDELEERSEEEDGYEDQKEQADSYKPWVSGG